MKRKKQVTIPELIGALGQAKVARALGVDPSLPCKWAKGQRPGWKNADALVALAERHGYHLEIKAVGGAR